MRARRNQEKTGQGTWRIFQRGTDYWVFIDGENDVHDGEWKIQFNGPGTESSWVGSKDYAGSRGIMAKFDNLLTMPTKEQYGIQEPDRDTCREKWVRHDEMATVVV